MTREKKAGKPLRDTKANRMRRARTVFKAGAPSALGVKPTSLTPEKVTASMRVGPRHLNRNNVVNGGVIMAFADVLGAAGALNCLSNNAAAPRIN
jgi:acyl-coenzyme A thioesterase PaaI-like protein